LQDPVSHWLELVQLMVFALGLIIQTATPV
jgi:hypothetical protein